MSRRQGEIIEITPAPEQLISRIEVLESISEQRSKVNIQESDILVSGGRGLENEKGFELLTKLAESLGAKVSASRAVVDAGWIPYPSSGWPDRQNRGAETLHCLRNFRGHPARGRNAVFRNHRGHKPGCRCADFQRSRFRCGWRSL